MQPNATCPICHQIDTSQRVAALFAAGVSSETFSGPSGGIAYADGKWGTTVGYNSLSGSSASNLARLLSPPKEPSKRLATWNCKGNLGGLLAVPTVIGCAISSAMILGGLQGGKTPTDLPLIIAVTSAFAVPCLLLLGSALRERNALVKAYPDAMLRWEEATARWQTLYFCHRDGIVFDPQTNRMCEPSLLKQFLFSE